MQILNRIKKAIIGRWRGRDPESRQSRRPSWREYQSRLGSSRRTRPRGRRLLVLAPALLLALAGLYGLVGAIGTPFQTGKPDLSANQDPVGRQPAGAVLDKSDVQDLLAGEPLSQLIQPRFTVRFGARRLVVETTIDPELQASLVNSFDTRHSRYIAIVVMNPENGEILALAGFDRNNADGNPCIGNPFPAASIFKIVTAAAAVEKHGYRAGTPLAYNGAKHTLYKSQLKEVKNRYTRNTTLEDAFAQSVNPVFGKLGAHALGRETLQHFGEAFGFNQKIHFEIPTATSPLKVDDEPYHWAEVASGFNRDTQISALHGALLAASLVNGGAMMEPTIIRCITDETGSELYRNQTTEMSRPVSATTTSVLKRLMAETIQSGTARKAFRGYQKDKVLSGVRIGGKTGSIDNASHDARLDWFVGYAEDQSEKQKIAVAAIVAHVDYIGKRAAEYARGAIVTYFQSRSGT
ncbi:MAG: penicillin-binding transpeptidase domain-containing protein [Desulfobacterales bacterium]